MTIINSITTVKRGKNDGLKLKSQYGQFHGDYVDIKRQCDKNMTPSSGFANQLQANKKVITNLMNGRSQWMNEVSNQVRSMKRNATVL